MIKQKGFTLIELLVVISVIGALSGVLINVINGDRQKQIAEDATKRTNLEKVCVGIDSYYQGEGTYPVEGDVNDPLDSTASSYNVAAIYLSVWPAGFVYDEDTGEYSAYVQKSVDANLFKCGSAWRGVQECYETTALNNISSCDALP